MKEERQPLGPMPLQEPLEAFLTTHQRTGGSGGLHTLGSPRCRPGSPHRLPEAPVQQTHSSHLHVILLHPRVGEEEGDRDRGELRDSGSREKQREGEKGGEMRKNEGREKKE